MSDESTVRPLGGDTAPLAEAPIDLHRNALSLLGLVVLGIAYMGLALTAYFNFGIMEGITGPIVPLAFAAVTLLMLPTAASYAVMNARRPSTGATLTWLWEATTPPAWARGSAGSWSSPTSSVLVAAGHVRPLLQFVPQCVQCFTPNHVHGSSRAAWGP